MVRRGLFTMLALLLASSCGSTDSVATGAEPPAQAQELTSGVQRCGEEPPQPRAPDDWYRDRPRYVGNEQPTEQVRNWAITKPGFQEIWIDRDRNGWVTVGFSEEVEERQAEILERFPDDGVVAVLLDVDLAALRNLRNEVVQALSASNAPAIISVSPWLGRVVVDLGSLSEANLAPLLPFADQPVCVNGPDPEGLRTGPQADGGEGWRLLAIGGSGRQDPADTAQQNGTPGFPGGPAIGNRTDLATTPDQLVAAFELYRSAVNAGFGPDAPLPQVDFATEVVILGNESENSCPILLWDVVADSETQSLTVDRGISEDTVSCQDIGFRVSWAVAVERDALLPPPFTIVGPANLTVETDLRDAGSSVPDDATVALLSDQIASRPPPPAFPHFAEPGFASTIALAVECAPAIGPVNGFVWTPTSAALAAGEVPDAWLSVASDGMVTVDVLLTQDPSGEPTLDLTAGGHSERYLIADVAPACPPS